MRQFVLFGAKPKYETMNWWENFMGGHLSIGPITIYGANAMCWTVNISTKKWGYICFTLPSIRRKRYKFHSYFMLSPNGTPWACTYHRGGNKQEAIRAAIRKFNFGHNFNTTKHSETLTCLNDKFSWFNITDYDLSQYGKFTNN